MADDNVRVFQPKADSSFEDINPSMSDEEQEHSPD
jgi:hypothetical protein